MSTLLSAACRKGRRFRPAVLSVLLAAALSAGCTSGSAGPGEAPSAAPAATPVQQQVSVEFYVTPEPTLVPTATPTPTATPEPTPFSVVWMSDTQVYSLRHAEVFLSIADWITQNAEQQNIRYVLHTGDVVDNANSAAQWQNASAALSRIEDAGIPMLAVAGNHDLTDGNGYRAFLSQEVISALNLEDQSFRGGEGCYGLFSAAGEDFIVIGVGFSIDDGFYSWARDVLETYADRTAILFTHSALGNDGSLTGPGKRLSDYVVAESPNVRFVLCGHYRGAVTRQQTYTDADGTTRTVPFLMYNYQEDEEKGLGYLRILTFDPMARSIGVRTYSPYLDDDNYDDTQPELDAFLLTAAF